ncbi:MAG: glycoside hydrolase family 97 N-terminal domain-containing protein [Clostridia bacterium]|nr:glycoside hydrolase family 97 N-terminal domain-containing protein [Clostridia bacterium]
MRKTGSYILKILCNLLTCMFLCISLFACTPKKPNDSSGDEFKLLEGDYAWQLTSQDEKLLVQVYFYRGTMLYEVRYDGNEVVKKSGLGLKTVSVDLTSGLTFVEKTEQSDVEISYTTITGKKSRVETAYNELVVRLKKDGFDFDVIVRAYNDGFAFRYALDANSAENTVIAKETSQFALPAQSVTYVQQPNYQRDYFSYEESYETMTTETMSLVQASMPMLYQTKSGVWTLLTESDIYGRDYIGSFLECDANGVLTTIPSYGAENEVTVALPFESPWRLGVVGSLATVVESTLVEDVYGETEYWKPDNYDELSEEEKAIYDYSWVTPGAAAWDWLKNQNSQGDYYMHMEYLDFALENGLKWIILDGGWNPGNPDAISLFKELVATAHENGVKVMVWGWAHKDMADEATMLATLDRWAGMGIDGLKIDYFDGNEQNTSDRVESQNTLKITERLYQECAKRKMVLNCHGCNKPTGERRVYPHVFNREAIRGNENVNYVIEDMVAMPFIRGSVGPSDYTPTLEPISSESTTGSQLAMHILLETGSISLGDTIAVYDSSVAKSFIMGLPARYDDLKLLGGAPTEYCMMMRSFGGTYYVAGITIDAREFTVDLSFLEEGKKYTAEIYYDKTPDPNQGNDGWGPLVPLSVSKTNNVEKIQLAKRTATIDKASVLKVSAPNKGGFALKIVEII